MSNIRDMCPDCQHPYSMHNHGGEGENAYPVCPSDFRDESSGKDDSIVMNVGERYFVDDHGGDYL